MEKLAIWKRVASFLLWDKMPKQSYSEIEYKIRVIKPNYLLDNLLKGRVLLFNKGILIKGW